MPEGLPRWDSPAGSRWCRCFVSATLVRFCRCHADYCRRLAGHLHLGGVLIGHTLVHPLLAAPYYYTVANWCQRLGGSSDRRAYGTGLARTYLGGAPGTPQTGDTWLMGMVRRHRLPWSGAAPIMTCSVELNAGHPHGRCLWIGASGRHQLPLARGARAPVLQTHGNDPTRLTVAVTTPGPTEPVGPGLQRARAKPLSRLAGPLSKHALPLGRMGGVF